MSPIPDAEWPRFTALLSRATYVKGQHLAHVGESFFYIGLVIRGLVRVYYTTAAGKEFVRAFCSEGQPLGPFSSMIRGTPSNVSMEAMEETEVVLLDHRGLTNLYAMHPCWQALGRVMAERYILVREAREYEFMTQDAAQRLASFLRDHRDLMARIPQYHVAAYLGITPVALSRLLNAGADGRKSRRHEG